MVEQFEGRSVSEADGTFLLPLTVGGHRMFVVASDAPGTTVDRGAEVDISVRKPRIDQMLDGLVAFANEILRRFESTDASKVSVQFGCDVAAESGTMVAVIGKASMRSAFVVTLEWTKHDSGPGQHVPSD